VSVINQMLKELEQRQSDEPTQTSTAATQVEKKSTVTIVLVTAVIVLLISLLGFYVWKLNHDNEILQNAVIKSQSQQPQLSSIPHSPEDKVENLNYHLNEATISLPAVKPAISDKIKESAKTTLLTQQTVRDKATLVNTAQSIQPSDEDSIVTTPPVIKTENTVVTPVKKISTVAKSNLNENKTVAQEPIIQEKEAPTLRISRSEIPPERVVQRKFEKAERAIMDNDVLKAEQLFEDILLIQPEHKSARKQLSALWFGRKLFQPALNLLSKGVALFPRDVDFRLMKARILLNQNNTQAAFQVLKEYETAPHAEYQVLLANTAQAVGDTKSTILAYQQLVKIEAHKGKWWLGLAVALDRNSEFEEARNAYQKALFTENLSDNTVQFVKQRMAELGE